MAGFTLSSSVPAVSCGAASSCAGRLSGGTEAVLLSPHPARTNSAAAAAAIPIVLTLRFFI